MVIDRATIGEVCCIKTEIRACSHLPCDLTSNSNAVIISSLPGNKELSIKVMRDDTEITVQVKPEDLSPRLKQLREERLKRKKSKSREG